METKLPNDKKHSFQANLSVRENALVNAIKVNRGVKTDRQLLMLLCQEEKERTRHRAPALDGLSQQDLLKFTMGRLNLTRKDFSKYLGVPYRTLTNWLQKHSSKEFRNMPADMRHRIMELVGQLNCEASKILPRPERRGLPRN